MCTSILPACVYESGWLWATKWVLKTNLGPLQEQPMPFITSNLSLHFRGLGKIVPLEK